MTLSLEWERRIDRWKNELKNHFYTRLGTVEMSGFITDRHIPADEVLKWAFRPMPQGTKWGERWKYGWFKGEVRLPAAAEGRRIVFRLDVGSESAIYVNGKNAGARDREHTEITLTRSGIPGESYQILSESYAGHGAVFCHMGPVTPERLQKMMVYDEPVVGESSFGSWEEEAYQLWLDTDTLDQVRRNIDGNSLRACELDEALKEFTNIVDFELPYEKRIKTFTAARKRLKPLLECSNGSTAPTMYAVGHSHIDVAWLWPLAETERKCSRTFATQLALLEEYPEYKFLQSQPHLYRMVKNLYPGLYERIKQAVVKGKFVPDGGMWVEADTNIPSGESLIRQFVHGKRFFKEEFGVESELMWLPDVFGYSAALPQIMRGCGIKYFSTAKIFWTYNGGDPFPYNTFMWEGVDGSEILVHLCNGYSNHSDPKSVMENWNGRVQKHGISSRLFAFGYGDGGGGATRDHIEYLGRMKDLEGVPKVIIRPPAAFFKEQEESGIPETRYAGELYFQNHRGTYTSQARTKKGNRKSEFALREAEMWLAAALATADYKYPLDIMDDAWKKVLLNQFHDIIPGSSIKRVYEEAEAAYGEVIATAGDIARKAAGRITGGSGDAVSVFNSLSWDRKETIMLPEGFEGAEGPDGAPLPSQKTDGRTFVEVEIPSCGWTTIQPAKACELSSSIRAGKTFMENEVLRLEINALGQLTSIYDKEAGRDLAAGLCNDFRMYKDISVSWDAWDIDSTYVYNPVGLDSEAEINVLCVGPLFASIQVKRQLNNSNLTQEITIKRNSRRVDFKTTIDWQESHKLLKVNFPVNIYANEAIHEIQFGHIKRPNHTSRQFDADRFEVSAHKWSALAEEGRGIAILNDCKYGVNVLGSSINLTLLKAGVAPDPTADRGIQEFTYSFYAWNGSLSDSDVVREAYELNCPALTERGFAGRSSMFSMDTANIIIDTVKPAEDGSGDIIIRMYEAKRNAVSCSFCTALPVRKVFRTNMLEDTEQELAMDNGNVPLDFRPFEVKTLRLVLAKQE